MAGTLPISVAERRLTVTRWDLLAVLLVLGIMVFLAEASRHLLAPLTDLQLTPISLDPANLPEYAARTTLRMLAALALSLVFTFTYATLAAKNKHAELLLVPLLDILQSVPILGFISVTVVFFMSLAPGRVLGAEFAAVFAIFTSQAWNMAFSFYQSLRTVPTELVEASHMFRLSPWMRFWRLDVPFAMPQLIFNMMLSMSGSWFFVVASEAISVGNTTITLPGVGSYIALAIEQKSLVAVAWAIGTMLVVILLYDQLLFRPLVAWSDRFRFEQEAGALPPRSWVLDVLRRSGVVARLGDQLSLVWRRSLPRPSPAFRHQADGRAARSGRPPDRPVVDRRGGRRGARRDLADRPLHRRRRQPRRGRQGGAARHRDAGAGRRAHRDRERRLGADRHRDRHSSRTSPISSSRWRSSSRRFRRTCCSRSRSRRSSRSGSIPTSGSAR